MHLHPWKMSTDNKPIININDWNAKRKCNDPVNPLQVWAVNEWGGRREEKKKRQQGGDQAYLLCDTVSHSTRARHQGEAQRAEGCGEEQMKRQRGTGSQSRSLCVIWGEICRLIQQLDSLSPEPPPTPPPSSFSLVHSLPSQACLWFLSSFLSPIISSVMSREKKRLFFRLRGWGEVDVVCVFVCVCVCVCVGGERLLTLPSTGGCYESALQWMNLHSTFPLRDPLTDINVMSVCEASECMEAQGWSCNILHIRGCSVFHGPTHFINTQKYCGSNR